MSNKVDEALGSFFMKAFEQMSLPFCWRESLDLMFQMVGKWMLSF